MKDTDCKVPYLKDELKAKDEEIRRLREKLKGE